MKKLSRTKLAALSVAAAIAAGLAGTILGADQPAPTAVPTFRQYCFQCHGNKGAQAGINLEQLTSEATPGESYQQWQRVIAALSEAKMPPKGMPQPTDDQRKQAVTWVRSELDSFVKKHAGDPGRVTVRRLTSGEYAYTIQDLTGLTLDTGIDGSSDSVGGEGFTNFGDVQFMQDANLERYLGAAKIVADHAVIGSGPIEFYSDPGKTGFELSAVNRMRSIYATYGFRTVSGEGGKPFGLDKYDKAFYAAWRYKYRVQHGEPAVTLKEIAQREGITARFAQHIWSVVNQPGLGYPSSDVVAAWKKIPAPGPDAKATEAAARAGATATQKTLTIWPSWFFARGDEAAGGQGDESPLIFNDASLKAEPQHHFRYNRGGRGGGAGRGAPPPGPARIFLNVSSVNPRAAGQGMLIWRNPTIAYRTAAGRGQPPAAPAASSSGPQQTVAAGSASVTKGLPPAGAPQPLRSLLSRDQVEKLGFGKSLDGAEIGPNDFESPGSVSFEIPVPDGIPLVELQVDTQLGKNRDFVYRVMISDRAEGNPRGIPTRALIGDPESAGYGAFKAGVMQFATILPPNSNGEPTPADKDPVPLPFDSTFNVPEHDQFVNDVKYIRDDRFIVDYILDDANRARLAHSWLDLYASFPYHDRYLGLLAQKFNYDLKGKHIGDMNKGQLDAMPAEMRKYAAPLVPEYASVVAAQKAAEPGHIEDCLNFAARAWRRPLSEREKQSLRAFYQKTFAEEPDHRAAIRALLTRILVAPQFLYRIEQPGAASTVRAVASLSPVKPLSNWELASRLSYFLWASIPDDELRRAAAAGELSSPGQLQLQVKRMLADPKARRLSTEFFGQWLGFYHFDQFKGVDTGRYPEFTQEVKESMYDEAVSFFEHIIRADRPVSEILTADYTYLDQALAKYYGVKKPVKSTTDVEYVEGERGGLLRLGAVLTTTSAPLRTSPVKRGDWILRRILGTPVPPPPPDAGSIPADDKLFGGLSVKERLQAHKRNATCANCHSRLDPLGFSLEHYDSTGRWRDQYPDGKPIDDTGDLSDSTKITGVKGLLDYLQSKDALVRRTLASKLIGYALGRTVQASDQPLLERMTGEAKFSEFVTDIVTSEQFRNTQRSSTGERATPASGGVAKLDGVARLDKVGTK